jgi:dienelactone hydrolase
MISRTLSYLAEGRAFAAEFRAPTSPPPWPGVLVCHDGAGLGEHARGRAKRLAALGFAALAPDLYGEPLTDRAGAAAMISALAGDAARLRGRLKAALALLGAQKGVDAARLAAIGFCFGGMASSSSPATAPKSSPRSRSTAGSGPRGPPSRAPCAPGCWC